MRSTQGSSNGLANALNIEGEGGVKQNLQMRATSPFGPALLANKTEVNQVHGAHKPHHKADNDEKMEAKEVVEEETNPAPEQKPGEEVSNDRKHRALVFRRHGQSLRLIGARPLRFHQESRSGSASEERPSPLLPTRE